MSSDPEVKEDVWIPTVCSMCYSQCGIRAHRVNGKIVKIEGNPESPLGMGRICAKGLSGMMLLYDPYRLNVPMKRTNPEKGMGIDPKWVEISWEEALDTITEKLRKIRAEDPRKLVFTGCIPSMAPMVFGLALFMPAFGSPNVFISNGHHCGNAEHLLAATLHGALTTNPDMQYCNYLIMFGCQAGTAAYYAYTTMCQRMADSRVRGMKLVVVDPMLNTGAEKADEWLAIKPGTDGALAMAMLHVLINELGIYDEEYLKEHTNAPYLIAHDGYYLRDKGTDKPLIWDPIDQKAKTYDDPTIKDYTLEGVCHSDEMQGRPAFSLLKEQIKKFTPEHAAEITTIPADTIRRIAKEFGEAARIGSTITIDDKELPYRPVSVVYFKGAHGHNHAWLTSLAIELLCEVVGASNVPGAFLGCNPVCHGYPETGRPHWEPKAGPDGLLSPGLWFGGSEPGLIPGPYPPIEPQAPQTLNLMDLLTPALTSHLPVLTIPRWEEFKIPYKPEMLINYGANSLMSIGNPEIVAQSMKDLFLVSFNLWLDETTDLADIVLPDACYLERLDPSPNMHHHHFPVGLGEWGWQIRQPVVEPLYQRRHFCEVIIELVERIEIRPEFYMVINLYYDLKEPYRLDPERQYSWEEIADIIYKSYFGPEHGLEWFKKHGVLKWPKKPEEPYWKPFVKARVPIYFEWIKGLGEKIKKIAEEQGLKDIDTSDFQPLPDWKPCSALEYQGNEYDLQAIYYRVPWHTFSMTYENPWLDEISENEPYSYFISLSTNTAKKKGIKDGDPIWVESLNAGKIKGRARLVEGIHPEVIGIANNGGHWSPNMPIAKDKGVFFEALLPLTLEKTDLLTITMDCDARVKIYKAEE